MILNHMPKKRILLFSGDLFLILFCYFAAPLVRFGKPVFDEFHHVGSTLVILTMFLMLYYLWDLYDLTTSFRKIKYFGRFLAANAIAASLVAAVLYLFPDLEHRRGIFLISAGLVFITTYLWRLVFRVLFRTLLSMQQKVVLVGYGWGARNVLQVIDQSQDCTLLKYIELDPDIIDCCNSMNDSSPCRILGELLKAHKVDLLVTAVERIACVALLRDILKCKMDGIKVMNMPVFYENHMGKLPIEHLNDFWFVSSRLLGITQGIYNRKVKRILDILLSLVGLTLSLPLTLSAALAIKLDSKGPLFYLQTRVGLKNKPFEVIKFRSMRTDAEKDGAVWASQGDNRVTMVGKFIRKTRIDEIPQMWNVLKGEMSFIGPRPERPEFVRILEERIPYYFLRHSVKPGITGWAQVNYPYGASEDDAREKLQYDLFYIKNLFPTLEAHILLKTVKVVLFGVGAR